jgi:hypothetical protein
LNKQNIIKSSSLNAGVEYEVSLWVGGMIEPTIEVRMLVGSSFYPSTLPIVELLPFSPITSV